MQKKTFTKWVNAHLARAGCRLGDLYCDLRDGVLLTRLLELLSGEPLVGTTKERPPLTPPPTPLTPLKGAPKETPNVTPKVSPKATPNPAPM